MLMKSTGLAVYAGKALKVGDEFEADEKDVHVLRVGKLATPAEQGPVPGEYLTRDMTARRKYTKRTQH